MNLAVGIDPGLRGGVAALSALVLQRLHRQQLTAVEHQPPMMKNHRRQRTVRKAHPHEIPVLPLGSSLRHRPQVKQSETRHPDFLRHQPHSFAQGFVLAQDGLMDRNNQDRLGGIPMACIKDLGQYGCPRQWEELFLTEPPANQRLALLRLCGNLIEMQHHGSHRRIRQQQRDRPGTVREHRPSEHTHRFRRADQR